MKTRLLLSLSACLLLCTAAHGADSTANKKPAKSEADQAYDATMKVIGDKSASLDQAQFDRIVAAGIDYLTKYPGSGRALDVVRELGSYPTNVLKDKNMAPLRGLYVSVLNYRLASVRHAEDSDEFKVAIAALDAAAFDAATRLEPSRPNIDELREKIDALAQLPKSGKFLAQRELSYVDIVSRAVSPVRAENHLRKLTEHPDKAVAEMARHEVEMLEFRKKPLELTFTGLDGKEYDVAKLRGKIVAVYFWSSTNGSSTEGIETLHDIYLSYRKAGFDVMTISYDKAEDRDKLAAFVKQNKISWPVYFDGKGAKSDFGTKLGVNGVPRLVLLDRQGMILNTAIPLNQLDPVLKKLLGK